LRREGVIVKVPPQPFTALVLLVRRAGALMTREELRTEIWGVDRHVDFDGGLTFCIAQLRDALADPASESKYIAAVPRRGYRFVTVVERVPDAEPSDTQWWLSRTAVAIAVCIAIAAAPTKTNAC
jgi:DNA-binding winged helix-turn-helix (wHTH) protein